MILILTVLIGKFFCNFFIRIGFITLQYSGFVEKNDFYGNEIFDIFDKNDFELESFGFQDKPEGFICGASYINYC